MVFLAVIAPRVFLEFAGFVVRLDALHGLGR